MNERDISQLSNEITFEQLNELCVNAAKLGRITDRQACELFIDLLHTNVNHEARLIQLKAPLRKFRLLLEHGPELLQLLWHLVEQVRYSEILNTNQRNTVAAQAPPYEPSSVTLADLTFRIATQSSAPKQASAGDSDSHKVEWSYESVDEDSLNPAVPFLWLPSTQSKFVALLSGSWLQLYTWALQKRMSLI